MLTYADAPPPPQASASKKAPAKSELTGARPVSITAALLQLYCCFTAALLLLYCCFTAVLLLIYCCFTAAFTLYLRVDRGQAGIYD
jgi:hypothetical protein